MRLTRRFLLLYVMGALVDDILTFYFVGIAHVWTETNPYNMIVDSNPYMFLALQLIKETITILMIYGIVRLLYSLSSRLNPATPTAYYCSRLIMCTAILSRWYPIMYLIIQIYQYEIIQASPLTYIYL